jgi:hypothetical protein
VEWLVMFALGHGIIMYLATIEIFPDRFVASMITTAVAAPDWAHWIMAGVFGLLGTFLLERFLWSRHSLARLPTASQGEVEPQAAQDTRRYMTAYEVIHYIADDSKWGDEVRRNPSGQISTRFGTINAERMPVLEAQVEFKRIAEQGHIHAVGRFDGVGPHVHIPETHWMSATINPFSLDNPDISETMPAAPNPDGIHTYKGVRIVREDVERAWPPATKKK